MKLLRVRRSESIHKRPVIESDRVDDERIAFVTADGFAIHDVLTFVECLSVKWMWRTSGWLAKIITTTFGPLTKYTAGSWA